ncbi:MAG: DMT family transporter [Pirellulales bacterium]
MTAVQIGELAAVATAILWTLSTLAWTSAGKSVGALSVSFIRLGITCVFLAGYGRIVRGLWLPTDASAETWLILGVSGVAGFLVADLCLFKSLLLIGPRLSLLILSLTPPMAALISWALLDDALSAKDWLAMAITLAGVAWVVLEQPGGAKGTPKLPHLRWGVLLAVLGAGAQAVGFVLSKKGIGDYDPVAATFIRVLASMVGYVALITVLRRWPIIGNAARQVRAMVIMTLGSIVGPFAGVALSMVAVRNCHAGVAATIISTMPVLILPFVVFVYHEKVSLRAVAGAIVSVVGVGLLVL